LVYGMIGGSDFLSWLLSTETNAGRWSSSWWAVIHWVHNMATTAWAGTSVSGRSTVCLGCTHIPQTRNLSWEWPPQMCQGYALTQPHHGPPVILPTTLYLL
jgi:hypothetical protein